MNLIVLHRQECKSDKGLSIKFGTTTGELVSFDESKSMKGSLCILLWIASFLDQKIPLVIATKEDTNIREVDLKEYLSDSQFGMFFEDERQINETLKSDDSGRLIECSNLSDVDFCLLFDTTESFVNAAKEVILKNESDEKGCFELQALVNQFILKMSPIRVSTL